MFAFSGAVAGLFGGGRLGEGRVEKQIQDVRRRFFTQGASFADMDELNAHLQGACEAHAAAGRQVEVHAYADRLVFRLNGKIVGEHRREFERDRTVYEPLHYLPVLRVKPGALQNGAPFRQWRLPEAMEKVRERLARFEDGDRQMVSILTAAQQLGWKAVTAACAEALSGRHLSCGRGHQSGAMNGSGGAENLYRHAVTSGVARAAESRLFALRPLAGGEPWIVTGSCR